MKSMMGGHGGDNLPKAQAIKDATMAHFILKNLEPGKLFMHFNGSYHSDNYEGINWYLYRSAKQLSIVTIGIAEQSSIKKLEEKYLGNADFIIAGIALFVGLVIENMWVVMGILTYPDHALAPYWIAILWVGLGLTINHSMALFRDHTLIGSVVVGIAATVTYLAGQRFGAVEVGALYLTP